MSEQYFVYIITNPNSNVMYVGFTSDLQKRIYQHKNKLIDGFSKKYNVSKLVYFEVFSDPTNAISREKQIKSWRREKKNLLVESANKNWLDLYNTLF